MGPIRTTLLATTLSVLAVQPLDAQATADVLAGIRNGGGWASIPITRGRGSVRTATMPAMGMTVAGCMTVWGGHSGDFEIRAHDNVSDSTLVVTAHPGVGVPFSHTFGMQAQVDFDVRWTEPRDTTLLLWVGLAIGRTRQEACQPVYARD